MFTACIYKGKPAVFDTSARVYYACRTMRRARQWAIELNQGK